MQVSFKDATNIQNGRHGKKVRYYSNFTITYPAIWRCAGYYFKVLLKFKMANFHPFEVVVRGSETQVVKI